MLEEQLLDPNRHDRQAFTSGVAELDQYLQRFAVQQSKKGITVVRVLVDTDTPRTILGYYSLSATSLSGALPSSWTFGSAFGSSRSRAGASAHWVRS